MAKKDKKHTPAGLDFYVPGRDELRPNARDSDPSKGTLAYVTPHHHVTDLGAPKISLPDRMIQGASQVAGVQPASTTGTPASAQFTPGWVKPPEEKTEKELRITIQPGIVKGS